MTLLLIFGSSFLVAFSGAIMPGPLLAVAIDGAAKRGPIAGPILIVGHAILEASLVVALFFGLAALLKSDCIVSAIAIAGGGMLLVLALGMLRSLPKLTLDLDNAGEQNSHLLWTGVSMSLANPYWFIWWATVGFALLLKAQEMGGIAGIVVFYVGHILADLVWYSLVALMVGKGRRFLSNRLYRGVIGSCAVFLVGLGIYFVYSGCDAIAVACMR